jgi:hypothetical protein
MCSDRIPPKINPCTGRRMMENFILDEHLSTATVEQNIIGQKYGYVVTHYHLNGKCRDFFFIHMNLWYTKSKLIIQYLN